MEKLRIWQIVALLTGLVCVALIIALAVISSTSKDEEEQSWCPQKQTLLKTARAPEQLGIFEDLNEDELKAVRDYMLSDPQLNITAHDQADMNTNYIFLIELYPPNKADALAFLDNGGSKPERVAKVVVHAGGLDTPIIQEYLVTPAHKPTSHTLQTTLTTLYPIPFHARPGDDIETKGLDKLLNEAMAKMYKLLYESYDGFVFHNCSDRCISYSLASPKDTLDDKRIAWTEFILIVDSMFSWTLDLDILIDLSGTDVSKWKILKVVYNDQEFGSVEELMEKYNKNQVTKSTFKVPKNLNSLPTDYYPKGGHPKYQPNPAPGPDVYEPAGNRFKVKGHHVQYMDWSFDFRLSSVTGVQIYDIRFNDERIIYELSLQEAASFYSAYQPTRAYADYLDTGYGMGGSYTELVPGWDCPKTALLMDIETFVNTGQPQRTKSGVCLFEWASDVPLRRHYDNNGPRNTFYGATKDHALVLRSIATVDNYDYIYDYRFHVNGVVQVSVYLTGYVLTGAYVQKEKEFAYKVMDTHSGQIHDHFMNFKVDLDIGGTGNNFEHIAVKTKQADGWQNDKMMKKYMTRELKKTEKQAAYKYNFEKPKYLNFYNPTAKNGLQEDRGYRIHLAGPVYQIYDSSHKNLAMTPWSKYQIAVTKHKETERGSSSLYNQNSAHNPVVNFDAFINDDENIENQDLVAWVTVGTLHIPGAEDIPNTGTIPAHVGFNIRPFNYFDIDPSVRSRDTLVIEPSKDGGTTENTFGSQAQSTCTPKANKIKYSGFS